MSPSSSYSHSLLIFVLVRYRNILFTENFTLKLADFGLSVMNNGDVLQYGCGAVGFMAPGRITFAIYFCSL